MIYTFETKQEQYHNIQPAAMATATLGRYMSVRKGLFNYLEGSCNI